MLTITLMLWLTSTFVTFIFKKYCYYMIKVLGPPISDENECHQCVFVNNNV